MEPSANHIIRWVTVTFHSVQSFPISRTCGRNLP